MQKNYDSYSKVYDEVMGKEYQLIYKNLIKKSLGKSNIKNKKILELGCGTGIILSSLSNNNKTFGVDISPEMIKIAKKNDKKSTYSIMNMVNFKLPYFYDIIFCSFDSINHLLNINDWKKTFKAVKKHLNPKGIFIFDFNTIDKFSKINNRTVIRKIKNNYIIMETRAHDNKCVWDISIFLKEKDNYKLFKEKITEATFPKGQIIQILKKYFRNIEVVKEDKDRVFISAKK
jgi:SAM-dependent methyltransferase